MFFYFSYRVRLPPGPPLFPYTTLFRSPLPRGRRIRSRAQERVPEVLRHLDRLRRTRGDDPERRVLLRDRSQRNPRDRKSTRLNSSHSQISYAVFCLKKKIVVGHRAREP